MTTEDFKRKLTAILSADVVGYSRLMGEDEAATVKTLETYKRVMFSLIKQHRGRVVDSPGDNLLAEFGSVVDAVQCAVSIQKELQTRNADLPEKRRMEFRIGINLGDVIEEDDRIYGDGVNIAARLEALADPGGICVSKTAFDHIESKLPLGYEFLGDQTVKNIAKPVGAYKVLMETRVVDARTKREAKAVSLWRRTAVLCLGIILILVLGGILYWNFYHLGPSIEPASVEKMAYPLPDKLSIAVLPFTNMSGDPEQDYIGDGLSENIISALSVSSQLFVMARNSTFTYKGTPVKVQQVAEDLGVQYVLEGSILKSGDRLRITAQLIDALSGYHLWSEVYDRDMRELFELLDEITKTIMVSLQVELGDRGEDLRLYAKSTDNLEAWKHYIKGVELFDSFNAEDNLKARECFEAAIELDPAFVAALSKLAETHFQDFSLEWSNSPLTSMSRAFELAQKAVEMDEQDPAAHAVLGLIYQSKRQHEKAISEGKRSITLNPNYANGYVMLALTMHHSGRFDEAITLGKKASRLNPNLPHFLPYALAASYIFLERHEEAIEVIRQWEQRALQGSRSAAISKTLFSWVYQELGREEEARAYMTEALKIKPDYSLENSATNPYKDPAHLQRMQDAFRKAGMPEKPPGAVQEKPSIAVLPFDDLSPEKDQEYFVLGLTEEILNSLAQISDLTVIAKTSSFSFRGTNKKIQEIANELGVDHIIEGSMRKAGNAIRITAQLIKADDESHLWSETYDKEFKIEEMFSVQEDIATAVADELKLSLGVGSLKQLGGTDNLEAYELYLVAIGLGNQPQLKLDSSLFEPLNRAIALDPDFALAWALKSEILVNFAWASSAEQAPFLLDTGLEAAQRAIDIEPNLVRAYFALGFAHLQRGEYIEAEKAYRQGMKLKTLSVEDYEYGLTEHYMTVGKLIKCNKLLTEIRQNDPFSVGIPAGHMFSIGLLSDIDGAEKEHARNKTIYGNKYFNGDRYITMLRLNTKKALSNDEIEDVPIDRRIFAIAKEHIKAPKEGLIELQRIYKNEDDLTSREIYEIAIWAAYFGDHDFAFDAIERSVTIAGGIGIFNWLPVLHEVRQLPRFKEFMKEIGLVDYWKEYGWPDLCRPVGEDDFVCD